jgi:hypothetical protein
MYGAGRWSASSSAAAPPACSRRRPSTGCWWTARTLLRLSPVAEITLEANPGTFEMARFRGYREAGVNRLSLGIQSFNPAT